MKKAKTPWDFSSSKPQNSSLGLSSLIDSFKAAAADGKKSSGKSNELSSPPAYSQPSTPPNKKNDQKLKAPPPYSRTVYSEVIERHNIIAGKVRRSNAVDSEISKGIVTGKPKQAAIKPPQTAKGLVKNKKQTNNLYDLNLPLHPQPVPSSVYSCKLSAAGTMAETAAPNSGHTHTDSEYSSTDIERKNANNENLSYNSGEQDGN